MLVDDQVLMRNGIISLLRAHGHKIVGEAGDGKEALPRLGQISPDLILMDIRMPGMNGLEATRLIKVRYPDTKIVMLTVSDDENDLFEAVKSGAHGYLLKDLEASQFFEALDAIDRGEAVISARLAGNLLHEFRAGARQVAEGFKSSAFPKVLVANGRWPKLVPEGVIAIVTDQSGTSELPTYRPSGLHMLAGQIVSQYLGAPSKGQSVSLLVDGVRIPLKQFPSDALSGIVKGFAYSLDGIPDDPGRIEITVING